jgi:type IV pilus assembly protein PilB
MNQKIHNQAPKEPVKKLINITDTEAKDLVEEIEETQDPVTKLVNRIIMKALRKEASEIHFEPQTDCLKVRFREDGILKETVRPLAKNISLSVVKCLKNMANLDLTFKNSYQEGRFNKILEGNKIHFWLNIIPTRYGGKAILRWWNIGKLNLNLAQIINHQKNLKLVRAIINRNSGLLLVTGPPNSGKSTTLYALIAEKNKSGVNISTIENRLKSPLAGITQIELLKAQNTDYQYHIKSLLNQDVEVIFIDRLQELTTATNAIDAASHGKSVVSTLNSDDAVGAIAQLLEMGVNPPSLAKVLNGAISQRLVRRVCPYCRLKYEPSSIELNRFGLTQQDGLELYHANNVEDNNCPQCKGIGYKGQVAIMEVLPITPQLRRLIAENSAPETLRQMARQQGVPDLLSDALELVMAGKTTLAEIERVLPDILTNLELEREVCPTQEGNFAARLTTLERQVAKLSLELRKLKQALKLDLSALSSTNPVNEELEEFINIRDCSDFSEHLGANFPKTSGNQKYEKLTESDLLGEYTLDKISPSPTPPQSNSEDLTDPW